jgi:basic amino acid/polyamine antiporter, APA family
VVCTVIYMAVAAVMTGVVPFRSLGVASPIAVAVDAMNAPALGFAIKVGSVTGLFSVMLILTYGQSRIFFAMARDGLLPPLFARLHPRFRTPWAGTIVLAALIALAAGLLPITILGDLVSLGTATAFGIVCFSVIWLRSARPDLERPFRVPLGGVWVGKVWLGVVPVFGILGSLVMGVPVVADIVIKAATGDPIPAVLLSGYAVLGAVIYLVYGLKHSKLAGGVEVIPPPNAQLDPPV